MRLQKVARFIIAQQMFVFVESPYKGLATYSKNLLRLVRDGKSVRCWQDPWVLGVGPLVRMIPSHMNLDLDYVLSVMVLGNGTWNLDLFQLWLPKMVIWGIVRNRNGEWIFSFNRFLGSCFVFEAELWRILDDLGKSNSTLIRRIFQLLTQFNHLSASHISKEDNQETDRLVNLVHGESYEL
ncbi:hypothetical protein Goari_023890 [Gossypium aridum]|uniref:Uncharacterized protein n=1 Tax=Gossypium aridum TaxID=34290 RepID=A0A7J8X4Y2_GOSAI|nr:hypothetical protein [Gossypium aridum]